MPNGTTTAVQFCDHCCRLSTTDSQLYYKPLLAGSTQPTNTAAAAGTSGDQEQASAYRENELTKILLLAVLALLYSFNRNINQSKHNGPTPKASTKH